MYPCQLSPASCQFSGSSRSGRRRRPPCALVFFSTQFLCTEVQRSTICVPRDIPFGATCTTFLAWGGHRPLRRAKKGGQKPPTSLRDIQQVRLGGSPKRLGSRDPLFSVLRSFSGPPISPRKFVCVDGAGSRKHLCQICHTWRQLYRR